MSREKRSRLLLIGLLIMGVGGLLIQFIWLDHIQWRVANELKGIEDWLARDPRYAESLDSLDVSFANIRSDLLTWYQMIPLVLYSIMTFLSGFFLLPVRLRRSLGKRAFHSVGKS